MDELRKNMLIEADITGYTHEGHGVCRVDGRAVFVPRTLPGERWLIRLVRVSRTAVWGRAEELRSAPSPERCEPDCPVYGRCGGCATRHMRYEEELRFKLGRVNDALQRIAGLELRADRIHAAPATEGYRNKAIYNLAPGPTVGFYRARSHEVIRTDRCALLPDGFDRTAAALTEIMTERGIPAYDETDGSGQIRHLLLRRFGPNFLACVTATAPLPDGMAGELMRRCPELTGVVECINPLPGNAVTDGIMNTCAGSKHVTVELCGAIFLLDARSFFQVNTAQAEVLYNLVREYAEPTGRSVLDLYCGVGSIGIAAARDASLLIGSDIVPEAVENARINADANGLPDAEYITGDASDVAQKLADRGLRPEIIIVDPPRKGLGPAVIEAIGRMAPEKLVYVSCDPATLARDLRELTTVGLTPRRAAAVDLFPRTRHVETVVLMSRKAD